MLPDRIVELTRLSNLAVDRLLLQLKEYRAVAATARDIDSQDADVVRAWLARIGDEMTFANPYVWLGYKCRAYVGADAITTIADLDRHCAPLDDICHQRHAFLMSELRTRGITDIVPETNILEFLRRSDVLEAVFDADLLARWQQQEYRHDGGRVAKWGR